MIIYSYPGAYPSKATAFEGYKLNNDLIKTMPTHNNKEKIVEIDFNDPEIIKKINEAPTIIDNGDGNFTFLTNKEE